MKNSIKFFITNGNHIGVFLFQQKNAILNKITGCLNTIVDRDFEQFNQGGKDFIGVQIE